MFKVNNKDAAGVFCLNLNIFDFEQVNVCRIRIFQLSEINSTIQK